MPVLFSFLPLVFFQKSATNLVSVDVDHDPAKIARDARKTRVAKNERQQAQNIARAQGTPKDTPAPVVHRKQEIDRTLATTRTSTASMGRFDRKLDGEKKLKGVKRKVR